MDNKIRKHAEILLKYSINIQKGETLLIQGDITTLPLITEAYKIAIDLGALTQVVINNEELNEILLKNGNEEQIQYIPASLKTRIETVQAVLTLSGSSNTRMLSHVDPDKVKLSAQGSLELTHIFFERVQNNQMRFCGTLFPNQAHAQEASMSLSDYQDFVYDACYLNLSDPISKWKEIDREQEKICEVMDTKKTLRIVSKDTDISMSVAGRKWVNCSGRLNFPDGEVFTGPVEDSVNGRIRFSFPGIYMGREIEDIQLVFEKGRVVKASAAKGEALLHKLLETDEGARYVGEVAVGTNYNIRNFTRHMLFDEKIGGTVHLAIGKSIPQSLAKNKSAIHWDMLCDMKDGGEIFADDQLVYKSGKFLI